MRGKLVTIGGLVLVVLSLALGLTHAQEPKPETQLGTETVIGSTNHAQYGSRAWSDASPIPGTALQIKGPDNVRTDTCG